MIKKYRVKTVDELMEKFFCNNKYISDGKTFMRVSQIEKYQNWIIEYESNLNKLPEINGVIFSMWCLEDLTEGHNREYPKIEMIKSPNGKLYNNTFLPDNYKENIIKRYGMNIYEREILGKWPVPSMEEKLLNLFAKQKNRGLRRESDIHQFVKDFHKKKIYATAKFCEGLSCDILKEMNEICKLELKRLPNIDYNLNKTRYNNQHLYAAMAYENNQKKRGDAKMKMEMKDLNTRMGMVEVKHINDIIDGKAVVKTSYLNNVAEVNIEDRTLVAFGINSNGATEELFDRIISAKIDGEILIYESEYEIETIDNREELYDLELSIEILKLELKYKDLSENERIEKKAEIKKLCSMINGIDPIISYSINWTTKDSK